MIRQFKRLALNSGIYSLGNLSTRLAGLILLPLYTDYLSVAEYGTIGIVEVTSAILIAVFGFGLTAAFNRWYWDAQYRVRQGAIFFTTYTFVLLSALLMGFILFLFAQPVALFLFDKADLAQLVRLMAVVTALDMVNKVTLTLLRLLEKAVFFTTINLIRLLINLGFTILLIVHYGHGILGIYEAQIIGQGVFFLLALSFVLKNMTMTFLPKLIREMLAYSLPLMLSAISVMILSMTDRYALRFITGFTDVGVYTFGFKIANSIKVLFVTSVQLAVTPIVYKMIDAPNNRRFYSKLLTYFTYALIFIIIGASIFSRELVHLLANHHSGYNKAIILIPIIAFVVLFGMMKDTVAIGINIVKKTHIIAGITIGVAVLNLVFNILFIPAYHALGAAVATLLSQIIFFLLLYFSAQKHYPVPYEIRKIVIMIINGAGLILIYNFLHPANRLLNILLQIGALAVFPIILYPMGFYEAIEKKYIFLAFRILRHPANWQHELKLFKHNTSNPGINE